MTRIAFLSTACIALAAAGAHALPGGEACARAAAEAAKNAAAPATSIDLAICLDTSGSMNGLLDSARARIWDIVSDLATAKPTPTLRVALVTFGNDGHTAENGWTNIDSDLTNDLDTVSQKLFALTTNGGTELVARVVDRATRQLAWSKEPTTLKIMVVAGNESADQDREIHFQDACKRAIEQGVVINSVYCGADGDGLADAWREVARLADGRSACINQAAGIVVMDTPFDAELGALNASLNSTYLPYGSKGQWGAANQVEQDANAARMGNAAQRCVTKGCESAYGNAQWDLVDAVKQADFKLEVIDAKDLPESMRALKPEERRAFVDAKAKERADIQAKILALGGKRNQFIAAEQAKSAPDEHSFERAIREAVRSQAVARGLAFPEMKLAPHPPAGIAAPGTPTTTTASNQKGGC